MKRVLLHTLRERGMQLPAQDGRPSLRFRPVADIPENHTQSASSSSDDRRLATEAPLV